ncbi:MAG: trigger factor [Candidatus Margulisiibacteriota bacterium]
MKIVKQEQKGSKVSLEVEVDYKAYLEAVDKVYKEASQSVKVAGFRQGKAPKSMLEKHFDKGAIDERAADFIMHIVYPEIIKEAKLLPVDFPVYKIISTTEEVSCLLSLDVDVEPEVILGKYKGLKAQKKEKKIEEKDLDGYIKSILEQGAVMKETSGRPAKEGDVVELDIEGAIEGTVEDDLSQRSLPILLGDNRIAPDFDANIHGMEIGAEKEFSSRLPKDYFIPRFAGKDVKFKVALIKLIERDLPDFNDEYVSKISSFKTVEEYRADLRKRFEESARFEAEAQMKDSLLETVCAESKVDIPSAILNRETDAMVDETRANLERSGLTLDGYLASRKTDMAALRAQLLTGAASRAKAKLVLRAIGEAEKVEVTEEDLQKEIEAAALESGARASDYGANQGIRGYIKDYLLRRKAMDITVRDANIK